MIILVYMLEKKKTLTKEEQRITNRFLSIEVPIKLGLKYPPQKIQTLFKINGRHNFGKKKQKKG